VWPSFRWSAIAKCHHHRRRHLFVHEQQHIKEDKIETQLSLRNRATRLEAGQGHQTIQYIRYGFLLVCDSNFVLKTKFKRFWDIRLRKNVMTLKPDLGITQDHHTRHVSIRHLWLPINVPQQPWAYLVPSARWLAISVENRKFIAPPVFCHRSADGWPLELGIGAALELKKTRVMLLPGRPRSLTISSAVLIQYTNVTGGRTDGHRATAKTALTHSVAR